LKDIHLIKRFGKKASDWKKLGSNTYSAIPTIIVTQGSFENAEKP